MQSGAVCIIIYSMNIQKLKSYINSDDILDLSNKGLSTSEIEEIINLIIDPQNNFPVVACIDFSRNYMDRIPRNFSALFEYMENSMCDSLSMEQNPFEKSTMDDVLAAFQLRNRAEVISIYIFVDDTISRAQCQQFIYNSLIEFLAKTDPTKQLARDTILHEHTVEHGYKLLRGFSLEVNTYSGDDPETKLHNLTSMDVYDFDQELLSKQAATAIIEYYGSPAIKQRLV